MEKIIEIIDKKELKDNIYKNVIQEKNIIIISMSEYTSRQNCRRILKNSDYRCYTEYKKCGHIKKVRCPTCKVLNSTDDSHNACCKSPLPEETCTYPCTNTYRWVECKTLNCPADALHTDDHMYYGLIYYHYDNPEDIIIIPNWIPTGNVLIKHKSASYKHLQNKDLTYKKYY